MLIHLGRTAAGSKEGNQSEALEAGPQEKNKAVGKSKEERGGPKNRSQSGRKGIKKKEF